MSFTNGSTIHEISLETQQKTDLKNVSKRDKNAFKFKKPSGVTFTNSIKSTLKDDLGCYYSKSPVNEGWICPIGVKQKVIDNVFNKNEFKTPKMIDIFDPELRKSKTVRGIKTQIEILKENIFGTTTKKGQETNLRDYIVSCREEFEDDSLSLSSFKIEPRLEDFQDENPLERQVKLDISTKIHNSIKKLIEDKEKLENLEASLELLENEGDGESEILEFLAKNEIGDAELFVRLFNEKYVFDPTEGKEGVFYIWNGSCWSSDLHKERYLDFERVTEAYLNLKKTVRLEESIQEQLEKRISQLRTSRRRKNVFETVSSHISFKDKWDLMPYMLPCANGIVNLKTGVLEKANSKQFVKKVCPVKYDKDAKCPNFEKFLNEITLGRFDLERFLARLFGYAVLGVPKEEKVFYFWGKGRNGKGTLIQIIQTVLGSFAKTFPSEMLLIQRNPPSSSSPNPEKANLEGVRLAIFSEINEGRKIDSAEVKNLSGRDLISCRRLFSGIDLQIIPTHTLILQTNYKPKAPPHDIALWARNFLIPFEADFTKSANGNLKEELLKESEGILNWIIEGCLEYQREGLKIPQLVLDQTEGYRQENDVIGRFLSERCNLDNLFSTPCQTMLDSIKSYALEEGLEPPSRNEISNQLKNKFKRLETSKGNSWAGVSIKPAVSNEYN